MDEIKWTMEEVTKDGEEFIVLTPKPTAEASVEDDGREAIRALMEEAHQNHKPESLDEMRARARRLEEQGKGHEAAVIRSVILGHESEDRLEKEKARRLVIQVTESPAQTVTVPLVVESAPPGPRSSGTGGVMSPERLEEIRQRENRTTRDFVMETRRQLDEKNAPRAWKGPSTKPGVLGVAVTKDASERLRLDAIRLDGGTQMRAKLDQAVIDSYAEDMQEGATFPPIGVVYDGTNYWLWDGFHRYRGAEKVGFEDIDAEVRSGTQRDAILLAAGANPKHGLRRSNEDKRRAVLALLQDGEWGKWSDREIARRAVVSDRMVNKLRAELSANGSQMPPERTVSRGGLTYTMDTGAIGKAEAGPGEHRGAVSEDCTEESLYPFMQQPGWKPSYVLAARDCLDKLPNEEQKQAVVAMVSEAGVPPTSAVKILENVVTSPASRRRKIAELYRSEDSRERDMAKAMAIELPPGPDPRILKLFACEQELKDAGQLFPDDPLTPRFREVLAQVQALTVEVREQHRARCDSAEQVA